MTNLILCGGNGTRLWPISRTLMPKQFIKLFDDRSLFQLTVERNALLCEKEFIVSNTEQYFLALDQIEEIEGKFEGRGSDFLFLLEPIGRNTAPAIALACMALDPEEIVLITPSDHLIKDQEAYKKALQSAGRLAEDNHLVTFGIEPEYPETGFGYIEFRGHGSEFENKGFDVVKFHEKPDLNTAKEYLKKNSESRTPNSEHYLWNSGMFCFKVGTYLDELKKHAPEIYATCEAAFQNAKSEPRTPHPELIRISHEDMATIPSESIDYAVMEKSDRVKVVPCEIGWSDLGSFDALYEELPKDDNGNTKSVYHIGIGSKDNLIMSHGKKIATIDIEDLIIVDTTDALLISKKGSSQKVKLLVEQLKERDGELTNVHTLVHRPWGTYEVLLNHDQYKIKRIVVKPGKRLSLQKHFHRNEHWIVVSGTASVTVGDEIKLIRPNESTYIKMGEVHRLENEGKIPVVLIEAQVGEYTGEDDIVRLDDDFARAEK